MPALGELQPADREALAQLPGLKASLERNLETYHFREALKDAMNIARIGNKYISDTEPWKVAKTDIGRAATILNVSLQICANLAIAFEPFTPFAAARLRKMIDSPLDWNLLGSSDILAEGHQLQEAELLFEKIEDEAIAAQMDRLSRIAEENAAKKAAEEAKEAPKLLPQKEECSFEDFEKMDIRTATVLEAERVPKTDKLLKLTIDTGIDKRVIVSGIAKFYSPEEMVGKQICILANLKPRVIRGIESHGMILMASEEDGRMRFVTPQETLCNGATIG